jgi:two-component system sensor histidine kinase TctE
VASLSPVRKSVRRRLLIFLTCSLLMLVAGATTVTYWIAVRAANAAYDRALLDPAVDLSDNIRVEGGIARLELSRDAQDALMYDQSDMVVFQIRDAQGRIIAGDPSLAEVGGVAPGTRMFFDGKPQGQPLRFVAMRTASGYLVQVGETLNKRQRLVRDVLVAELVPTLLIALAAIAVAWIAVTHGLAPLERVRVKLLHRSPQNLEPLDEADAPDEMAPAVQALNRLLERSRAANAVQQRFLANSAHQLRTPLAGLQMHMELFLRRQLAPELREEVERMQRATIRTARLATQLLALANVESAGEQRTVPVPVDLKDIADAAAREWVPRALAANIDLGFALDAAIIVGDPLLLQQMLNNVVDNALRYTPSSGTVTVRTGMREDVPYISVEDTGPGIPAWARAKVVERFFRVDGTPGEGSGLGLAIVKEVVDQHGGTLTIEAAHGEVGTRIFASFPPASLSTASKARA